MHCFQLYVLHPLHNIKNEEQYENHLCNESRKIGSHHHDAMQREAAS